MCLFAERGIYVVGFTFPVVPKGKVCHVYGKLQFIMKFNSVDFFTNVVQ
jgi:hypothetical protein